MGKPADESPQPKALTFETARAIQLDIEALPGGYSSNIVSLAERDPTAYRVEIALGGIGGLDVGALQAIATKHDAMLRITPEPDRGPPYGLLLRFDRIRRY